MASWTNPAGRVRDLDEMAFPGNFAASSSAREEMWENCPS
jgi:hypothetical protein